MADRNQTGHIEASRQADKAARNEYLDTSNA